MTTKYKTERHGVVIIPLQILRETDQFVYVKAGQGERRESKVNQYSHLHDTWEDAHAFLLERTERRLQSARINLQHAQGEHGNVKGMRKPIGT